MSRDCHDREKKHRKPDIVLTADIKNADELPGELFAPLPLTLETCEYILHTLGGFFCVGFKEPQLITKKKHRQLKVKGSVSGGEVVITIQTGEETPRVKNFPDREIDLTEDLVKGDKITFQYGVARVNHIKLKALIIKKHH